jgi:hypothetical protein
MLGLPVLEEVPIKIMPILSQRFELHRMAIFYRQVDDYSLQDEKKPQFLVQTPRTT